MRKYGTLIIEVKYFSLDYELENSEEWLPAASSARRCGMLIIVVKYFSLDYELEYFNDYGTYKSERINQTRERVRVETPRREAFRRSKCDGRSDYHSPAGHQVFPGNKCEARR